LHGDGLNLFLPLAGYLVLLLTLFFLLPSLVLLYLLDDTHLLLVVLALVFQLRMLLCLLRLLLEEVQFSHKSLLGLFHFILDEFDCAVLEVSLVTLPVSEDGLGLSTEPSAVL
jgi:hypothetical protein